MKIKPLNDDTLVIKKSKIKFKSSKNKKINSLIPKGMQKIIKNEKLKQILLLLISTMFSLAVVVYITLLALVYKSGWASYLFPVVILLIFLYKLFKTLVDYKAFNRQIKKYEEDLKIDSSYTPSFLTSIYSNSIKNQVIHNWLTFTILFYGFFLTLFIWGLKDTIWWILDFKNWIKSLFVDPNLWIIILSISLISLFGLHLIFTIQRNKKKQDIKLYFNQDVLLLNNETEIKNKLNKSFKRLFILKIMIILVFPIIIFLILKRFRKK